MGPHPAQAKQEILMPKVNGAQAQEGKCHLLGGGGMAGQAGLTLES